MLFIVSLLTLYIYNIQQHKEHHNLQTLVASTTNTEETYLPHLHPPVMEAFITSQYKVIFFNVFVWLCDRHHAKFSMTIYV